MPCFEKPGLLDKTAVSTMSSQGLQDSVADLPEIFRVVCQKYMKRHEKLSSSVGIFRFVRKGNASWWWITWDGLNLLDLSTRPPKLPVALFAEDGSVSQLSWETWVIKQALFLPGATSNLNKPCYNQNLDGLNFQKAVSLLVKDFSGKTQGVFH